MAEQTRCLKCDGTRIVDGTIESRGPIEKRAMFHVVESKAFKLSLKEPYIPVPRENSKFCFDCGLCWNVVTDLENAHSIIESWGTDELKESLKRSE